MSFKIFRLSAILLASTALAGPAAALQANTDGAKKLTDVFETYLGKPAAGKTSAVTVVPEGEGYRVTLSLAALAAPVANSLFGIEGGNVVFSANEQPDGNWHVVSTAPLQATIKVGPQVQTILFDGLKFDGVFDPKAGSFISSTMSIQKVKQTVAAPEVNATVTSGLVNSVQSSILAGNGGVSSKIDYNVKDFREDMIFSTPKKDGAASPEVKASLAAATLQSTMSLDAFRSRKFLELWAFLVAHPSKESVAAGQADLKAILRPLLPLFEKMSGNVILNDVSVQTPIGAFAAKSLGAVIGMTGLVAGANFSEEFKLAGLSIPPGLAPPWSAGLVPTDAAFGFRVQGLDLAAASKEAVEDFSLNSPKPISDADGAKILAAVAPGGKFDIVLTPGRLASALLEVTFDGAATVNIPQFSGKVTIHAKGLDAALETLKKGMATDKSAAQAFGVGTMAKGLGKTGAGGSTDWVVEYADGGVKINGTPFGGK